MTLSPQTLTLLPTFEKAESQWPVTQWPPEKCQWPQWSGTLPAHWHFPNVPVTWWPWDMSVAWDFAGHWHFPNVPITRDPEICQWTQWPGTFLGHWHFPNVPVTRWPWEMSVASVAWDYAGSLALSKPPSDPVTLRNFSGLSGLGLCRATGTFPKSQEPGDPEKCQWLQWPGTLLGHWLFPNVPVTRLPWDMLVALVAWDIAGPLALSQCPSDPVTLRYVSGLSGLGLFRATGTFATSQWPGDPEKCLWPQWPGTLPGHWHFPNDHVTWWPWEMSVALVAQDFAGPLALSQRPNDPVTWDMSVALMALDFDRPLAL